MLIHVEANKCPELPNEWAARWRGTDCGVIASWTRGREIALSKPEAARAAHQGELPVLPWRGGVDRAIKGRKKVGSVLYLAMWQGLRGDDLHIDLAAPGELVCTRYGVAVRFTNDQEVLLAQGSM